MYLKLQIPCNIRVDDQKCHNMRMIFGMSIFCTLDQLGLDGYLAQKG